LSAVTEIKNRWETSYKSVHRSGKVIYWYDRKVMEIFDDRDNLVCVLNRDLIDNIEAILDYLKRRTDNKGDQQ
jgi:hypothetical protein